MTDTHAEAAADRREIFTDLTEADWQRIVPLVQRLRFRPGQTLVRRGEHDPAFFILTEGEVTVTSGDEGEARIALIAAPSVFGEVAFFDEAPRSASVVASSEGAALRVTRDAFFGLSEWEPRLARIILLDLGRVLATRLRDTTRLALR